MPDSFGVLLISLLPIAVVSLGFALIQRRRGTPASRILWPVLVVFSVALVTYVLGAGGLTPPSGPVWTGFGLAIGLLLGGYAIWSWQRTGWTRQTRAVAVGAALALTEALLTWAWR